jgi:Glycosyltransferase family 87
VSRVQARKATRSERKGLQPAALFTWLCAAWVTLFQGQRVVSSFTNGFYSTDLPAYLVGFRLAASRGPLYDLDAQRQLGAVVRDNPKLALCPFNYPPHLAAVGSWLPEVRYSQVLYPALVLNTLLVLIAAAVTWRWIRAVNVSSRGGGGAPLLLAAVCVVMVPAAWLAVYVGSITPVVLLGAVAVCAGVLYPQRWNGWLLPIGVVALAIKPQFAVVVGVTAVFLLTKRQMGLTLGLGAVLATGCTWWFGAAVWGDYVSLLQTFASAGGELCRLTGGMINAVGAANRFGVALDGSPMWALFGAGLLGAGGIGWAARHAVPEYKLLALGASMALALLVSPHTNPQDALLAIPLAAALWVVGSPRMRYLVLGALLVVSSGSYESMWGVMPFVLISGVIGAVVTSRSTKIRPGIVEEMRPESVHL